MKFCATFFIEMSVNSIIDVHVEH